MTIPNGHDTLRSTGKRQWGPSGRCQTKEIYHHHVNATNPRHQTTLDPTQCNSPPKPQPKSRRSRHRHNTKHYRTWLHSLHCKTAAETTTHLNTLQCITTLVRMTQECRYKLLLNPSHSPFQNAITNITHTQASQYYSKSKLAFHDSTNGKIVPPLAKTILGLGIKFIRTPLHTTDNISTTTT